ncbi:glycosyltransferase [Alteromonas oceanisediminis]|uniref:glycosyltransferase n=1 Tax=Alteromonas oceanisediminis TaxID=2836180 RepID=UPI001BDA14E5|nr:glycosyltransferase [Alteromonas oceanisediminis]MBT0587256.1 glycosyltransferase [Alteromonas oceanisediminis]
MHVVVIGYVWPEPNSSAAGQNMVNLLTTFVTHGWQVSFLCAARYSEYAIDLTALGVTSQRIELNCDSTNTLLTSLAPDIVVFDRFTVEEQFSSRVVDSCPNALRVLNIEDLHALRDARQKLSNRAVTHAESPDLSIHTDLFYREIAAILRSDLTLLLSAHEIQFLQQRCDVSTDLLYHWPLRSAITSQKDEALSGFSERQHFVFIGNFRHEPNWNAVLWLAQSLWPQISQRLPDAQLHVYGAYPPAKAMQLHSPKRRFFVQGWADSAHAVLSNARVCLAPLRFGAGVKGKFLDAIQTLTPSVTTSIGCEGITTPENWPGICADQEQQIIDAAVELYQDQSVWGIAQARCQSLLHSQNHTEDDQRSLINRLTALMASLPYHRENNFLGAMLRHHSLASTRYMTQWIAAKNAPD